MSTPIVVGVDGSPESRSAIDLGMREARLHDRPLRLVHAFVWPTLGVHVGPSPEGPPGGGLSAQADRLLAGALEDATRAGPDLPITGEVVTGLASGVLLAEARRAAMVVLGHRGLGGFTGLLVGSVALQVATHSPGPVLIARGEARDTGPVVAGVDGSGSSGDALSFALAEAATRGAVVVAVNTWWRVPDAWEAELPLIYDTSDVDKAHRELLSRVVAERRDGFPVAERRDGFPQVPVEERVVHGRAARELIRISETAQLMVVGARGRGGFTGLLLGSVSQALLHHAHCPVAIVRPAPDATSTSATG